MFILESADAPVPQTGRRAAIVTIVMRAEYQMTWARLCRDSWQRYAQVFDLDVIVIAGPLDTGARASSRSPAWQKLLILNQPWAQRYERIIWLDSDIIIAPQAQNIMAACGPAEKIALTLSGSRISDSERMLFLERLYRLPIRPDAEQRAWIGDVRKNYDLHGVPQHDIMFNTGVLVLSPQHHNALFLHCYEGEQVARLYEQPLLSHEIIQRDLAHPISARFNWGIQEALFFYLPEIIDLDQRPPEMVEPVLQLARYFVRRELANAYFLHFYGTMGLMKALTHVDVFGGEPLALFVEGGG
jgi:hypothetical protein